MALFKALVQDPDLEWEFIDGSIVKAHQHSAGAASEENQAIGKSRGGNTTKIHMAVDAYGLPIDFEITGGGVGGSVTLLILTCSDGLKRSTMRGHHEKVLSKSTDCV